MSKNPWQTTAIVLIVVALGLAALLVWKWKQPVLSTPTTSTSTQQTTNNTGTTTTPSTTTPTTTVPATLPDETPVEHASTSGNMIVTNPQPNQLACSPFHVTGRARVFENQFTIRLLNAAGSVLMERHAYANAPDIGQFGDFDEVLNINAPSPINATLEVFDNSARDGSVIDLVTFPISISNESAC